MYTYPHRALEWTSSRASGRVWRLNLHEPLCFAAKRFALFAHLLFAKQRSFGAGEGNREEAQQNEVKTRQITASSSVRLAFFPRVSGRTTMSSTLSWQIDGSGHSGVFLVCVHGHPVLSNWPEARHEDNRCCCLWGISKRFVLSHWVQTDLRQCRQ